MAFLDDLGSMLPGQQGGGWQQWLADPVNRAGLLSFGAQALTGTGGNFASEMGAAISKGFEGASATDTAVRAQREADEEQERKSSEAAANRSNQMEVAKLNAASREEVARQRQAGMMEGITLRNQGAMERTQVRAGVGAGAQGKPPTLNQAYVQAQREYQAANPMQLQNMTPEQVEAMESRIDARAMELFQKGRGTPGAAPAEAAPPGAAKPAAPAAKGAPAPQSKGGGVSLQNLTSNPKIAPQLATPEGRAAIRQRFPNLSHLIDEYEAQNK